jgi:hypothetical protein
MKYIILAALLFSSVLYMDGQAQISIAISIDKKGNINTTVDDKVKLNNEIIPLTKFVDSNKVLIGNSSSNAYNLYLISTKSTDALPCSFKISPGSTTTLNFNSAGIYKGCILKLPVEILIKDESNANTLLNLKLDGGEGNKDSGSIASPLTKIPYYDALSLLNKDLTHTGRLQIIQYYNKQDTSRNVDSIHKRYRDNPFLKDIIDSLIPAPDGEKESQAGLIFPENILSSVGGIDVTNIAQGMSQFMIDRAKEELNVAFFNRFKTEIDKNEEIKALFPSTARTMGDIMGYQYPQMLPALRVSFNEDMKLFPQHIDDLFKLPKYKQLLREFPEVRVRIQSIRIIQSLETESTNAADIIKDFADLEEWSDSTASNKFKNMGNTLKLARVFSESVRYHEVDTTNDEDTIWISPKQLRDLFENKKAFTIYLGLIYQQVKNEGIQFVGRDTVAFTKLMEKYRKDAFIFQDLLAEFITLADKVEAGRKEIKVKRAEDIKLTEDDYYNYINTGIDVVAYGFDIIRVFNDSFVSDDYIKIARSGNELYRNVYRKEYTSAVLNGVDIINATLQLIGKDTLVFYNTNAIDTLLKFYSNDTTLKLNLNTLMTCVRNGGKKNFCKINVEKECKAILSYFDGLTDEQRKALDMGAEKRVRKLCVYILTSEKVEKLGDLMPKVTKYGVFIAGMANAKTAEDVAALIESSALPAGSSSIKKSSKFNVSLQSYLGIYGRLGSSGNAGTSWNNQYGLHGPVGISASIGLQKAGSLSAFFSVFDLGAIIDYQLQTDSVPAANGAQTTEVTAESKIKLGQILSPGAFLVYGFPFNLPISFGIGTQYGPGLNKIESNGIVVANSPSWRPCMFLSVDIPLVTLFNSRKQR